MPDWRNVVRERLDLSRIEAGVASKGIKPVKMNEPFKNSVDFPGAKADTEHQFLSLNIQNEALSEIMAAPLALEGGSGNLITHAINYTQEGGTLTVIVDTFGSPIRVLVADSKRNDR